MLDHIFLAVSDIDRSIAFYERVLPFLWITNLLDYDGEDGPAGHSDLKGFGAKGRMFFWRKQGSLCPAPCISVLLRAPKRWGTPPPLKH